MRRIRIKSVALGWFVLAAVSAAASLRGASVFTERPHDPQAVYVGDGSFGARGDGKADDTAALQAAINRIQETKRRGIVFIHSGRYRLTKALLVWSGIRLIGYGPTRPVFELAPHTPGFQTGADDYLVHFVSERPERPGERVRDANPGTFYSAMSNIGIRIGAGNPAAVGVRTHYAQHCFLAHMNFWIGDGRAGVEEVGNLSRDLHFHGGEFGITTHKPSPSWPFVLLDSTFDGQRRAAIQTDEAGLTLVRVQISDAPTAILVRPHRAEELWIADSRFDSISGPALVISDDRNARTEINAENLVCRNVPKLAHFRVSGKDVAGSGAIYRVKSFCHGLQYAAIGVTPSVQTSEKVEALATVPPPVASDVPALPPMSDWVNLRSLGAKGDGVTDDTAVLRKAIATHRVIYFPSGWYRISDTVKLRADTVLIGLDPITTRIMITDFTPAFQGVNGLRSRPPLPAHRRWYQQVTPFPGKGAPKAMLEAPGGGNNIVTGIGLDTGGANNRAVALKWMSGRHSLVDDVRFLGGHGTYGRDGLQIPIYDDDRTGDPHPFRKWDSEFWSLWVTDSGGGTFMDIWTPSTFAAAGLYVSNTDTPGRIYQLSSEHHVRNEVKFHNVSHWRILGLQTEEERGESPHALPLQIENCDDITVGNFFAYRVAMPNPFSTAIEVTGSRNLDFRGLHVYSPGKLSFDNTLVDQSHGVDVRAREIAWLHLSGRAPAPRPSNPGPEPEAGSVVKRLAGGFTNIDGAAADKVGNIYFVDQRWSSIYRWAADGSGLSMVTDAIPQPVAVAVEDAGHLLVVSDHGNVYGYRLGAGDESICVLMPLAAGKVADGVAWLPTNRWRDGHDWIEANTVHWPLAYQLPGSRAFIPASTAYANLSKPRHGWGTVDLARTYELAPAHPGQPFYVSDEFGQTTWRFQVTSGGRLSQPERFAEEGEAGTAVDATGNVYVCAGNVFVYDRSGRQIDLIHVPERPSAVVFGDKDGKTLFITARSSLYAVRTKAPGREFP